MTQEEQLNLFELSQTTPVQVDRECIPKDASIPIPPHTYSSLDNLAQDCNVCYRCDLGHSRTQAVVGRGNPQADVMIIGEAPGQQEDETGLPFVGRSGQLLDKILASVKLDPEKDIYIANINKCRPPNNRKPNSKEIKACKPYLLEQIRLVDPKIILLTGATSLQGLIEEKRSISKVRGQWLEWDNRLCMAIFHPAYLLRNPSREKGKPKWLMWQDIQNVRNKLDEIRSRQD
jgi:DNA polymerase